MRRTDDTPTETGLTMVPTTDPTPAPHISLKDMIREGDEGGYPTVAFDHEKRANFYLNRNGEKVYEGVPDGFRFTADGILEPKE